MPLAALSFTCQPSYPLCFSAKVAEHRERPSPRSGVGGRPVPPPGADPEWKHRHALGTPSGTPWPSCWPRAPPLAAVSAANSTVQSQHSGKQFIGTMKTHWNNIATYLERRAHTHMEIYRSGSSLLYQQWHGQNCCTSIAQGASQEARS